MSTSDRNRSTKPNQGVVSPVGYRKPPVEYRFKPGQSGNPRGRRKGLKNEATILSELLYRQIRVSIGGKRRTMTVLEAIYRRFVEDALKGNSKSATFLLARLGTSASNGAALELSQDDAAILKDFADEIVRTANLEPQS